MNNIRAHACNSFVIENLFLIPIDYRNIMEPEIGSSKILAVSADMYLRSVGKDPINYQMHGIHFSGRTLFPAREIASRVPPNTEVVVEYRAVVLDGRRDGYECYEVMASGVALTPKESS